MRLRISTRLTHKEWISPEPLGLPQNPDSGLFLVSELAALEPGPRAASAPPHCPAQPRAGWHPGGMVSGATGSGACRGSTRGDVGQRANHSLPRSPSISLSLSLALSPTPSSGALGLPLLSILHPVTHAFLQCSVWLP